MIETLLIVIGIGLLVLVAISAISLARVTALVRARDATAGIDADIRGRLESLGARLADHERDIRTDLAIARNEQAGTAAALRQELGELMAREQQGMARELGTMSSLTRDQLMAFGARLAQLAQGSDAQMDALRRGVEQRLDVLREENIRKLEEMRATVDEKLQATLEKRLGDSFSLVSERLEQVHKGLGEMQQLAVGVGDLKRVMSNVKMRGGWGEVQLGALLAELLTPAQFATNVATRPGRGERVEFAIALPGRGDDGTPCWLPIDSKFPLDAGQRLQDAQERADAAGVETSRRELDQFFKSQARAIRESYVEPPHTTDFAILFVPTEGLYAEAVSRAGLADGLQREHRVVLAGPTTLAALLNSLQIGFRTLAIEKQSAEVWRTLGAVKTDFGKFGDLLAKTKEKLDKVGETLEDASRKSRTIERKLRNVEALPAAEAELLLGVGATPALDEPDEGGDVDAPSRNAG
jgi:DNA recombination protein RmuC